MTFRGKALYALSNYYGLAGRLRDSPQGGRKVENIDARVLILDDNNRILLVLEKEKFIILSGRDGFTKPSKWGLPGGRNEPDDRDVIDAAMREVREETGLSVLVNERSILREAKDGYTKIVFVGYLDGKKQTIKINPEEILECRWFPKSVLSDEEFNMYRSHRMVAKDILRKLG